MSKRMTARPRMQIYFDIIQAIKEELTYGEVKPTRIQFKSKLSYDSLLQYFGQLEKMKMISRKPISLTEKGKSFLQDYTKMTYYLNYAGAKGKYATRKIPKRTAVNEHSKRQKLVKK